MGFPFGSVNVAPVLLENATIDDSFAKQIGQITAVIPADLQATKPAPSDLNSRTAMNILSEPHQVKQGSRNFRL